MQRRTFLELLAGLGAVWTSCAEARLPGEGYSDLRTGLIGVGGAGCNVLTDLAGKLINLDRTIAINLDKDGLSSAKADIKILVELDRSLNQPREARDAFALYLPMFRQAVEGLDWVVIVTGLGGTSGTGIAPLIAGHLQEQGKMVAGMAFTPFSFEDRRRHRLARLGSRMFARHTQVYWELPCDQLVARGEAELTLAEIFRHGSVRVGDAYRNLDRFIRHPGARLILS